MSTRFSLSVEMNKLTRDGTAETVMRDQVLRRERGQGNIHFSCSASRIGNLARLIHTLVICDDRTYILVGGRRASYSVILALIINKHL